MLLPFLNSVSVSVNCLLYFYATDDLKKAVFWLQNYVVSNSEFYIRKPAKGHTRIWILNMFYGLQFNCKI